MAVGKGGRALLGKNPLRPEQLGQALGCRDGKSRIAMARARQRYLSPILATRPRQISGLPG